MVNKPLRVLFISHQGDLAGGADQALLTLISELDPIIIRPLILVPRDDSLAAALRQQHIPYVIGHYRGWFGKHPRHLKMLHHVGYRAFMNLSSCVALVSALRDQPVDLIYTNSLFSPIGALLARKWAVPHIWHAREFVHEDFDAAYDFGTAFSMKVVDTTSTLIICNSQAVQRKLQRFLPDEKLVVVYNGFPELDTASPNLPEKTLPPTGSIRLSIVGRVSPGKGQIDAIRALTALVKDGVEVELRIVGTGEQRYIQQLQETAQQLGAAQHIVWTGFIANPKLIYENSDITLVCSQCEAFGRVAVEALAAGCPVIATNSGGLPEIVQDGCNGLLYQYGDHLTLARQIKRLIEDQTLYRTLAHNAARSVYGRFGVERYVSTIQQLIVDTYTAHYQNRERKTGG